MQKKPHAKDAKVAKAELDEGFGFQIFTPFSEWILPRKNVISFALFAPFA